MGPAFRRALETLSGVPIDFQVEYIDLTDRPDAALELEPGGLGPMQLGLIGDQLAGQTEER
jgi:hypothetical protein